jgi:site-specific recombinase XerD
MAAVHHLDDPAAQTALILLRCTGMQISEVLDLELDCLWDLPGDGTWIKVPLGKPDTERVVPLDSDARQALDDCMRVRGRQRVLPHPRDGGLVDFLFVVGGRCRRTNSRVVRCAN